MSRENPQKKAERNPKFFGENKEIKTITIKGRFKNFDLKKWAKKLI
jgi:hypothetical protein